MSTSVLGHYLMFPRLWLLVGSDRPTDRQCQLLSCPGQLKSFSYHPSSLMNPSLYILQILFLRFERNTLSPILVQCQAPGRCWFYKREIWFRGQNKSKLHFPQFWCSSSRKNLLSPAFFSQFVMSSSENRDNSENLIHTGGLQVPNIGWGCTNSGRI